MSILLVSFLISSCDDTAQVAEDAMSALRETPHDADFSQLGHDAIHLDKLPDKDFSSDDLNRRHALVESAARSLMQSWAARWAALNQLPLITKAAAIARDDTLIPTENFKDAVSDVTEDAIRGQTCQLILNYVAPNPNPAATNPPDNDEWQSNIADVAENILAKTFDPDGIARVMDWNSWTDDVTSAAQQASRAIVSDPVPYANLLSNPAGVRATYVYAKYCYAPPVNE
jgi:hypothetical protein